MTAPALAVLIAGVQAVQAAGVTDRCTAPEAGVRLDHVPIAVEDLAATSARFREELGFSLKPGRPHENGLVNAHVRFEDGSELELMSVEEPSDALASWYARFLEAGEGGAFLALDAGPVGPVTRSLADRGLSPRRVESRAFDWVLFDDGHPLHHVFFIDLHGRVPDTPAQLTHRHGETGLRAVWIETGDSLEDGGAADMLRRLLVAVGAVPCSAAADGPIAMRTHLAGFRGEAWGVEDGTVYLVAGRRSNVPRILAVELEGSGDIAPRRVAGIWIETVNVNYDGR